MSFKSSLELPEFFNRGALRRAGGRAVYQTARDFVPYLQEQQENSPHTGKVVTKSRGANFRVRHQQSRRGQRPAPFTRKLLRSVKARRVNETSAEVNIEAPHAEHLLKMDRILVSDKDLIVGQRMLDRNCEAEIKKLNI